MRVMVEGGTLRLQSGANTRETSILMAQGGDVFISPKNPSVELRFLVSGIEARGLARYHNGWFVGAGARTGDLTAAEGTMVPRRRSPRKKLATGNR